VFPNEKRPNALVYFTLDDESVFGSTSLLGEFGIHSHNGGWMDPCKKRVYYIGRDNQIYDHATSKAFANTAPFLLHFHKIMLINVRGTPPPTSNKARKQCRGTSKARCSKSTALACECV
jgi:hypothetical protein